MYASVLLTAMQRKSAALNLSLGLVVLFQSDKDDGDFNGFYVLKR